MCGAHLPQLHKGDSEVKVFRLAIILSVLTATPALPQSTQCTATVTASVTGNTMVVTATASGGEPPPDWYSGSWGTGVDAFFDGNLIEGGARSCPSSTTCTVSVDIDTRCMARGDHEVLAHGNCPTHNPADSQATPATHTVTIDRPKPSVGVSYAHDAAWASTGSQRRTTFRTPGTDSETGPSTFTTATMSGSRAAATAC